MEKAQQKLDFFDSLTADFWSAVIFMYGEFSQHLVKLEFGGNRNCFLYILLEFERKKQYTVHR